MGLRKQKIPATLATDSCKLTEVMARGLTPSITSTAKARAVGPSYSRSNSRETSINPDIMQARITEGENPATAAKRTSTGSPTSAVKKRFRKVMAQINANKIEICRPDTATTWRMPLIFRSVSVS